MIKKRKHYINNPDFLNALIEYKLKCDAADEIGKTHPPIPDYIGKCFMQIAERLVRKPNFASYTFREEMIGDGIENCVMYFRNFNPLKSNNPFAYFTQIVYYAYLRRIAGEKKQLYLKYKATEQFGILDEGELYETEDGITSQFDMYDNIAEYIKVFEDKKAEQNVIKKRKAKAKNLEVFFGTDEE